MSYRIEHALTVVASLLTSLVVISAAVPLA